MATIDSLANETLSHIIEYLKVLPLLVLNANERQKGRYDALRAAALVCSRWRDPAQRALFDEIHLPDPNDPRGELFCASLARPRYRTRSLYAHSWGQPHAWLTVAKACAGIESLVLQDDFIKDRRYIGTWGELAHPAFQGLKHLGLMYLQHLADPVDISEPLAFNLTSLALWFDEGGDDPPSTSPHFIRALCAASLPNLSKLDLHIGSTKLCALFHPSFLLLGPHLRTLVLAASDDYFKPHNHYDSFTTLTSLRRFEIDLAWLYEDYLSSSLEFLSTILDHLPDPPSLKYLSIKSTAPPSKDLILVLEHKKLAMIEELVWCAASSRMHGTIDEWELSDGGEATRRVCEERGIRYEIVDESD